MNRGEKMRRKETQGQMIWEYTSGSQASLESDTVATA